MYLKLLKMEQWLPQKQAPLFTRLPKFGILNNIAKNAIFGL